MLNCDGDLSRWARRRCGVPCALGLVLCLLALGERDAAAQAQALLLFANQAPGVQAVFYEVDGLTPLAGVGYSAACYVGNIDAPESQLFPLGAAAAFRTGASAGLWTSQNLIVPFPGGTTIKVQVRFWATEGRYARFEDAENGGGVIGVSMPILVRLNGEGVPTPLVGLQSASLVPILSLSHGLPNITSASTSGTPDGSQFAALCGVPVGANRWFRFYSSQPGLALLSSVGSEIDTVLSVFTGSIISIANLQEITCNDDRAAGELASQVEFPIETNRLYLACLAGKNGATGLVRLNSSLATVLEIHNDNASQVELSWPLAVSNAVLEVSSTPSLPDAWQVFSAQPVCTNSRHLLRLERGQAASFYRLRLGTAP